jgi:hypothetical protein
MKKLSYRLNEPETVLDEATADKHGLTLVNQLRKVKPVCKDLGHQFPNELDKSNGPEVFDAKHLRRFGSNTIKA